MFFGRLSASPRPSAARTGGEWWMGWPFTCSPSCENRNTISTRIVVKRATVLLRSCRKENHCLFRRRPRPLCRTRSRLPLREDPPGPALGISISPNIFWACLDSVELFDGLHIITCPTMLTSNMFLFVRYSVQLHESTDERTTSPRPALATLSSFRHIVEQEEHDHFSDVDHIVLTDMASCSCFFIFSNNTALSIVNAGGGTLSVLVDS